MSSTILRLERLPYGTKPNTVYAQFNGEEKQRDILNIYTHPDHKGKAWVIFSSKVATGKHECRKLFGEGQKYYTYLSSPEDNLANDARSARRIESYTDFIAKKNREQKTSTLLITGLTLQKLWREHLDIIFPRGIEGNTAYCEKETSGKVRIQFFDKSDAEEVWMEVMETGMHNVYHLVAQFVDDVCSAEAVSAMQEQDPDDEYYVI